MLPWPVELPVNKQERGEGIEAGKGGLSITKLLQKNTRLNEYRMCSHATPESGS